MKTLRIAALAVAVSGVFTLGAKAGTDTNNWWDVTFDDKLGECDLENQTVGRDGAMVVLTNQTVVHDAIQVSEQTWSSGIWYTQDGDETIVTNGYFPTNTYKAYGSDLCLKLDTQGNDLTWRVDPTNTMADSLTALVDADLYLVGSDSPPDAGDFDASGDVQTAVYLKNETDEDTGETTNSVLCVYVYDADGEQNYWQELKGVKVEDNSWASVKVVVDHAKVIDPQNDYPVVQVFVNGVKMTARDGDTDHWTVANFTTSKTAARVSSVAFRGTGAVDNFVGKLVETTFDTFNFTAQVVMDGTNVLATGTAGNVTRTLAAEAGEGKTVAFPSFEFHDQHWDDNAIDPETGEPGAYVVSYALTKIEITDLVNGTTQTFTYSYNRTDGVIVPQTVSPNIAFDTEIGTDEETGEEYEYYSGPFSVSASTAGATEDSTVVKVYFESLPAEGQFKLTATQNVGTAPADQIFNVNDENLPAFATFTFAESISAGGTSYILSKIKPGTAPADPITLEYESPNAVVKVPLSAEITGTQYDVATATYVEGTLGDRVLGYEWDATNGEWSFTAKDKPVAIIVAGNVTNEYSSLRAAIEASAAGDTIVMIADDAVSFTAENPILDIEIAVTIDGGSNTLYGISDFAGEGYNEVRIGGSGNVTIKNLAFSEFGDTAPLSGASMPICTRSTYTGKLVLDGVTIDKFNRQALLLCGGEFLITNSVITGCAGEEGKTSYFQSAFENYFAAGTIVDTTVTGIGALDAGTNGEGDPWAAAVFTVNPAGNGSYTVLSGDYEGQFIVAANLNSAGSVILSNGTFVATAPKTNEVEGVQTPVSAFLLEGNVAVTVAGGWYDREPEAKYIAEGLAAYEDAPGTDAPWTVRAEKFTITFMNGATKLDEIEVEKNGAVAYAGETPEKEGTAQYSYTFAGWSTTDGGEALESLPDATANATYYAVFTESVNQYKVEWIVDGDRTTNEWAYGATPSYGANDPTKESTDATNFTFKAWNPEVVAVTGFASYTATWTETARTYAITFQTNGVDYATVDAEWHSTGYAPADPAAPEGKVFKGWALSTAPTTVLDTLPEVSGAATYVAVFDDDAVEVHVNPGDGLDTIENAPAPIEFTAAGLCKIAFKAPAAGKYVLMTSTTVNGTYQAEGTPVEFAAGALVELTETTAGTTKFFKIGYEK